LGSGIEAAGAVHANAQRAAAGAGTVHEHVHEPVPGARRRAAPEHRRTVVAQNGCVPDGQERRRLAAERHRRQVPDRVDARVDPEDHTPAQEPGDHAGGDSGREQLPTRHRPRCAAAIVAILQSRPPDTTISERVRAL